MCVRVRTCVFKERRASEDGRAKRWRGNDKEKIARRDAFYGLATTPNEIKEKKK